MGEHTNRSLRAKEWDATRNNNAAVSMSFHRWGGHISEQKICSCKIPNFSQFVSMCLHCSENSLESSNPKLLLLLYLCFTSAAMVTQLSDLSTNYSSKRDKHWTNVTSQTFDVKCDVTVSVKAFLHELVDDAWCWCVFLEQPCCDVMFSVPCQNPS